jgi:hypothetical protein
MVCCADSLQIGCLGQQVDHPLHAGRILCCIKISFSSAYSSYVHLVFGTVKDSKGLFKAYPVTGFELYQPMKKGKNENSHC